MSKTNAQMKLDLMRLEIALAKQQWMRDMARAKSSKDRLDNLRRKRKDLKGNLGHE